MKDHTKKGTSDKLQRERDFAGSFARCMNSIFDHQPVVSLEPLSKCASLILKQEWHDACNQLCMERLTVEDLVEWTDSSYGGLILHFTPQAFRTVCYFLREFAVPTTDPFEEIGAFQTGDFLVVGKRHFRDGVRKEFKLSR